MNNKGFTMVELLVAMAIMGLLIIMAFPTIRAIQTNNTDTKFREYGTSAISAAKLYTNSYAEDMFDNNITNQATPVQFTQLVKKDLLKEIGVSDAKCIDESYVTVVKYGDDYAYCLYLKCTDKTGTKTLYKEENKRGNCSKFSLVTLTYKATINEVDYSTTRKIISGEDSIKTLTEKETTWPFESNHYYLKQWKSSIGNYNPGAVINKPIDSNVTFTADYYPFKYTVKYASGLAGTSGSMSQHDCTYGVSCVTTGNKFSKDYYTFKNWTYNGLNIPNNADLNEYVIDNRIPITNNKTVTLNASFGINQVYVKYNANGGSLASQHSSSITLSGNKILYNNSEIHHTLNADGKLNENGLIDYNNKNWLNLTRSGFSIKSGQEWKATSGGSTGVFSQSTGYLTAQQICPNVKTGNCTVNFNANWVANPATPSYTCAAGKYLPANKTTCATCLKNYYCAGGTFTKKASNQGITKCPSSHPISAAGSKVIGNCYTSVTATFTYNIDKYHNFNNLKSATQTKTKSCNAYYGGSCAVATPKVKFGNETHKTSYNGHSYPRKDIGRHFTCTFKNGTYGSVTAGNNVSIKGNATFALTSCSPSKKNLTVISDYTNVKVRNDKDGVFTKGIVKETFKGFVNSEATLKWDGSWMIDKSSSGTIWFHGTTSPKSKSHKCTSHITADTCSNTTAILTGWMSARLTTD